MNSLLLIWTIGDALQYPSSV